MEHKEYSEYLGRLESEKISDPAKFQRKVQKFIRLGYFIFIGLALFFLFLFLFPLLMSLNSQRIRGSLFFLVAGGAGLYNIVKILLMKFGEPQGERLQFEDAPALFRRVEEIGKLIGGPPITSISLTYDLNASASAVPKYFLLGRPDLHVSIGIPLMAFLRPEEVDEVIAHELAHHTNRDADTSLKVFRVMEVWKILSNNESTIVDWSPMFANWYYPRLSAMSAVLRRDREFEADRLAAVAVGQENSVRAHFRLDLAASVRYEVNGNRTRKAAQELSEPFPNWIRRMLLVAREPVTIKLTSIESEGRRVSLPGESHPTLRERILAIGGKFDPEDSLAISELQEWLQEPLKETGIDRYLGGPDSEICKKISLAWQQGQREAWETFRDEQSHFMKGLEEFRDRKEPLTPYEHIAYANYLVELGQVEDAVTYLRHSRFEFPDNLAIMRAHALISFELDPIEAEPLIEEMASYPAFLYDVNQRRYQLLQIQGKSVEAESTLKTLRDSYDEWAIAYEQVMPWEENSFPEPTGAAMAEIERIRSIVSRSKAVESVFFARMSLNQLPGLNQRVLVVVINRGVFLTNAEDQFEKVADKLADELSGWTQSDLRIFSNKDVQVKKLTEKLQNYKIYSLK